MKKASAKMRRKIKGKLYRELSSMSQKFDFKSNSFSSYKDSAPRHKRK